MSHDAVHILLTNAGISAGCFFVLWLIALMLKDVSFIDSWWALGMVVLGAATQAQTGNSAPVALLVFGLTALWGVRLGLYLLARWWAHGADPRYQLIIRRNKEKWGWSFAMTAGVQVFALQGVLQFIVALPVQLGQIGEGAAWPGPLAVAGAVLALSGIAFESIGDWQLARFKADPANQGRVLDSGLWRYTRHPNYFGDTCVAWGLFLAAAEMPLGLWSLPAPILLTFLLTRVSGVPLLEGGLRKRRPDYEDYIARTSGFFPWFPKAKR